MKGKKTSHTHTQPRAPSSAHAHGLGSKCQLLEDNMEDAEQQIVFLAEIQRSIGKTVDLLFLSAVLAWKKDANVAAAVETLDEAVALHLQAVDGMPVGPDMLTLFNPEFLLEAAGEYLRHCGSEPREEVCRVY